MVAPNLKCRSLNLILSECAGAMTSCDIKSAQQQHYPKKFCRVLLIRAQQAVVIWVPEADKMDSTHDPKSLNDTANFLGVAALWDLTLASDF